MNSQRHAPRGYLPRLAAGHYRGRAIVLWTHTVAKRATGWLDDRFHAAFREIMLHAAVREQLLCPVYTLMPDHARWVWMGVAEGSDQRSQLAFCASRSGRVGGLRGSSVSRTIMCWTRRRDNGGRFWRPADKTPCARSSPFSASTGASAVVSFRGIPGLIRMRQNFGSAPGRSTMRVLTADDWGRWRSRQPTDVGCYAGIR